MNGRLAGRIAPVLAGAIGAALLAAWLWRLRSVGGAFLPALSIAVFLFALARPTRALVLVIAVLPLTPISAYLLRGPAISWGEIAWLAAASGSLLAPAGEKRAAAPGVFAFGLFVLWAALDAFSAVAPYLPPGVAARLGGHLLASAPELLDATSPFAPVRAVVVLFEAFLGGWAASRHLAAPEARGRLRRAALLAAGGVSLYAVAEQAFGWKLWPRGHYDVVSGFRRVASTLPDPNALGSYLVLMLFWAAGARRESVGKKRDAYFALEVLFGVALLLSGSRVAWLAAVVVGGVRFVARRGQGTLDRRRIAIALAVLVGAALLAPPVRERLALTARSRSAQELFVGRLGYYRAAVRMIRAHPVAGVGTGRFYRDLDRYRDPDFWVRHENAHNYFLQTAAESGITGLLLLLLAVAALIAGRAASETDLGAKLGLAAFGLTLLSGHALLVPEVAVLVFGVAASLPPPELHLSRLVRAAAAAGVLAAGASLSSFDRRADPPLAYFGIWPPAEAGGPEGSSQNWAEDLFAVPPGRYGLCQPVGRLAGKSRVAALPGGQEIELRETWTIVEAAAAGDGLAWFRSNVLWCPEIEDGLSRDRRLLSIRVAKLPR